LNTAMILAAGRGERMRPLTDMTPKPLLQAGANRLIEWQISSLVRAGIERIVINHAWLGEQFASILGDGSRYGCELRYSAEQPALETAGGIAKAVHTVDWLANSAAFIVVSGDIYSEYDYRLLPRDLGGHAAHVVLVNNPPYNAAGDMCLDAGNVHPALGTGLRLTYGNIGVFNSAIFAGLPFNQACKLFPWLYAQGPISGEHYAGTWHNVGTPEQLRDLSQLLSIPSAV
jgi:N-acetyl-alpha-D-muramate 1-phosphate uridylyltransferase